MDKITEILNKHEITEKSLYFSRAKLAMEEYGKLKWKEAQQSANDRRKPNELGRYPAKTATPFKN